MVNLHPSQKKLLEILRQNNGNQLSIKEIGRQADIDSPGILYHHIRQLEKKGLLKRNPNNPRDFVVMDSPEKHLVYVNKYGLAQCGPNGLFASENVTEQIPIASSLLRFPAAEAFIVSAEGDSMTPIIQSGDVIIARKQTIPEHGDIIVCIHNGKAMIKIFSKNENEVSLKSKNYLKYDPIKITEADDFRVEGVVKNIIQYQTKAY